MGPVPAGPLALLALAAGLAVAGVVVWALVAYEPAGPAPPRTAAPVVGNEEAGEEEATEAEDEESPPAAVVDIPADAAGFRLSLAGWGTMDRVEDFEDMVHRPGRGNVFLITHVQFEELEPEPGVETLVSNEGARLLTEDGRTYEAEGGGFDGGFCAGCTLDFSTSDERFIFSFLFVVPRELDRIGLEFEFQFRDAEPLRFVL